MSTRGPVRRRRGLPAVGRKRPALLDSRPGIELHERMRRLTLVLVVGSISFLGGCEGKGACIEPPTPGASIARGSCAVNLTKSMCNARFEFVAGGGETALATCRARGFTNAIGDDHAHTPLSPAEIDKRAKDGKVVTLHP